MNFYIICIKIKASTNLNVIFKEFLQKYSLRFQQYTAHFTVYIISELKQGKGYKVKYNPPPEGTPKGGGLYLTVYPESSPYISIIMVMIPQITLLTIRPVTT